MAIGYRCKECGHTFSISPGQPGFGQLKSTCKKCNGAATYAPGKSKSENKGVVKLDSSAPEISTQIVRGKFQKLESTAQSSLRSQVYVTLSPFNESFEEDSHDPTVPLEVPDFLRQKNNDSTTEMAIIGSEISDASQDNTNIDLTALTIDEDSTQQMSVPFQLQSKAPDRDVTTELSQSIQYVLLANSQKSDSQKTTSEKNSDNQPVYESEPTKPFTRTHKTKQKAHPKANWETRDTQGMESDSHILENYRRIVSKSLLEEGVFIEPLDEDESCPIEETTTRYPKQEQPKEEISQRDTLERGWQQAVAEDDSDDIITTITPDPQPAIKSSKTLRGLKLEGDNKLEKLKPIKPSSSSFSYPEEGIITAQVSIKPEPTPEPENYTFKPITQPESNEPIPSASQYIQFSPSDPETRPGHYPTPHTEQISQKPQGKNGFFFLLLFLTVFALVLLTLVLLKEYQKSVSKEQEISKSAVDSKIEQYQLEKPIDKQSPFTIQLEHFVIGEGLAEKNKDRIGVVLQGFITNNSGYDLNKVKINGTLYMKFNSDELDIDSLKTSGEISSVSDSSPWKSSARKRVMLKTHFGIEKKMQISELNEGFVWIVLKTSDKSGKFQYNEPVLDIQVPWNSLFEAVPIKGRVLVESKTTLYTEPHTKSKKKTKLRKGAVVSLEAQLGGWYKVTDKKNRSGWVRFDQVQRFTPQEN